ncbi:MAG: CAP domain-containing protein [Candidatus Cloacimonadaceae bacterium]|nr:CAP domain-containing protein [Candidatus Cloacimonadaceae bacterium]
MAKYIFSCIAIWILISILGAKTLPVKQFEQRIFELTNVQRLKYGLKALVYEDGFAALAKHHSNNMARHNFFDHKDKEGLEVGGRKDKYYPELLSSSTGENLAMHEISTRKYSPEDIVTGWMNSPSHRENILTPEYTHLGVGVVLMGAKLYSTQNFGVAIVKLKSAMPISFTQKNRYVLEYEYLSPESRGDFKASLKLPDPKTRVMLTERSYVLGYVPVKLNWKNWGEFSVVLDFKYGKGTYELNYGWGDQYFDRCYVFKVK